MATYVPRRQNRGLSDLIGVMNFLQREEQLEFGRARSRFDNAKNLEDRLDAQNEMQDRGGILNALGNLFGQKNFLGTKDELTTANLTNEYQRKLGIEPVASSIQRNLASRSMSEKQRKFTAGELFTKQWSDPNTKEGSKFDDFIERKIKRTKNGYASAYADMYAEEIKNYSKEQQQFDSNTVKSEIHAKLKNHFKNFELSKRIQDPNSRSFNNFRKTSKEYKSFISSHEEGVKTAQQAVNSYARYNEERGRQVDVTKMEPPEYQQYINRGFAKEIAAAGANQTLRNRAITKYTTSVRAGDEAHGTNYSKGINNTLRTLPAYVGKGTGVGKSQYYGYTDKDGENTILQASSVADAKRQLRKMGLGNTPLWRAGTEGTGKPTAAQILVNERKNKEFKADQNIAYSDIRQKEIDAATDYIRLDDPLFSYDENRAKRINEKLALEGKQVRVWEAPSGTPNAGKLVIKPGTLLSRTAWNEQQGFDNTQVASTTREEKTPSGFTAQEIAAMSPGDRLRVNTGLLKKTKTADAKN